MICVQIFINGDLNDICSKTCGPFDRFNCALRFKHRAIPASQSRQAKWASVMRAPLIAIVLSSVGGAVCAQPADEGYKVLETCFQLARAADAVCSDPKNEAAERLDCRYKASSAQLDCLERAFPKKSAGSVPPKMLPRTVSPEMPIVAASPKVPAGSVSPETPIGTAANGEPTSPEETHPGTVQPGNVTATVSPEMTTDTASPGIPAKRVDIPAKPQDTNWIVSETTSPVDYSPLVTAVIRSTTSLQDAPNTLAVRCRGPRTEVLLRTEGTWRAFGSGKVQVDYQINDQPLVRLQWSMSADGKAVTYRDDAVGFFQSLPEGARLKINVLDGAGPGHEATFQLAGLDAIRKRIAVPCKWATAADKMSSGKR